MKTKALVTVAASIALNFIGVAHAQSTIVDISATSGVAQTASFAAGTYAIAWIDNTANGGYNGWSAYASTSNWREAFSFTDNTSASTFTYDAPTASHYAEFATASGALAAFQSGSYAVASGTGPFSTVNAAMFTLTQAGTVSFFVPDNIFWDNSGGVSLAITAAVPEPETYALLLAGLASIGFIARRRQAAK